MSDQRYEDIAISSDGKPVRISLTMPVRFLEIDRSDAASTGGSLLVTLDEQLPITPCNPDDPSIYPGLDVIVRDQERVVTDLGVKDWTGVLRIVEQNGQPFHARINTDTERIGNEREGVGEVRLVNTSVVAFEPVITNLNSHKLIVDGVVAVQIPLIAGDGLEVENNHATATLWIGDGNTVTDGAGVNPGWPIRPGGRKVGFDVGELSASAQKWLIYDTGTAATAVFTVRPGA